MKKNLLWLFIFLAATALSGCREKIGSQFNKSIITEGISEQFICPEAVEASKDAAECFNIFFEQKLDKIKIERNNNVPDDIIEAFREVAEENIFKIENSYHIKRNNYGSPYFIENGKIYREHG